MGTKKKGGSYCHHPSPYRRSVLATEKTLGQRYSKTPSLHKVSCKKKGNKVPTDTHLKDQIAKIEQQINRHWRFYGRLSGFLSECRAKLNAQLAHKAALAAQKQKLDQIRLSVRAMVDHYCIPVFRSLKAKGHPLAGAALGIGRKIASGGDYTRRQLGFWESLQVEAGLDPEPFEVFET